MPYRTFVLSLLASCCILQPALAAEYPKVLFGSPQETQGDGQSFDVSGSLLQIQLTPALVVSAGHGALINLYPGPDDDFVLTVNGGAVIALELDTDRAINLRPGAYRIGTRAATLATPNTDTDYKQGFALADYYMVRQQSYLETLHVDVTSINEGLSSLLHHLFPHGK